MAERGPGLIAGFDAGQTHTTCRLAEACGGAVLCEGQGPGVTHLAAPEGPLRFQAALSGSLEAALSRLAAAGAVPEPAARPDLASPAVAIRGRDTACWGVPTTAPSADGCLPPRGAILLAAAIGASGIEIGTTVQQQGLTLAVEALGLPPERLWVGGDERTALRGAFPDGPGIVVISGTGTIAVGRDGEGREHRCAGWGWMLDGAGSAFDIGRDALALSLQMADGRLALGPLLPELWQALELDPADPDTAQAIKAQVVMAGFMPAGLAALAPVVERLAAAGDVTARGILERNAAALATSVAGVARALELQAPPVSALGGAISHLSTFQDLFQQALAAALPAARLVPPAGDATSGALALAGERLGGADRP